MRQPNREEWLLGLTEKLRSVFDGAGFTLPDKIRVSCSWPSKSALAGKKQRVGECWSAESSGDKHYELFISPVLADTLVVGATLVHELVHAAVGLAAKHGPAFRACALAMGLTGKMTATTAGAELTDRLHKLTAKLGPYPHAVLRYSNATPKQTTRMIKVECPDCGYVARTTRKWLEVGVPTCPCGTEMQAEEPKED